MSKIEPFAIQFSQAQFDDLEYRLRRSRLPERETVEDWSQGVPRDYLKGLINYWVNHYDTQRLETRLNRWPQFTTEINRLKLHFLHIKSNEKGARPLLLSHGWPGSVVEFLKVIPMLVDPVAHGGKPKDAFDVVCPSVPGFGFSEKPSRPGCGVSEIAETLGLLMQRLGYASYFAQGGDWGSAITTKLAQQDDNCKAIHLNMLLLGKPAGLGKGEMSDAEKASLESMQHYARWDSGYSQVQSTRPQTIGYSLLDSPAGLLAWIVEKFWAWTDCDGKPENAISRDEMLDNVMLYWLTETGASSARLYWESYASAKPREVLTPTGVSVFPKEIVNVPRHWAEKIYKNIVYWNELPEGGHFAAFEQPQHFVNELRSFFGSIE